MVSQYFSLNNCCGSSESNILVQPLCDKSKMFIKVKPVQRAEM